MNYEMLIFDIDGTLWEACEQTMIAANEANVDFIHARYGFERDLECEKHIDNITELLK